MGDAQKPTYREAQRRYQLLYWPAIILYSVLLIAGSLAAKAIPHPEKWMLAAFAVINTAPIAAVFLVIGRWLRETDEYTRKKQVEAMLAGAGLTFTFITLWGFLELYNLAPPFFLLMLWPAFFFSYGGIYCARCLLDRRASVRARSASGVRA